MKNGKKHEDANLIVAIKKEQETVRLVEYEGVW